MMECSTVSELIMKYLDGETTDFENRLLSEHVKECKNCRFELKALSDTFSALDSVKMEEPPIEMEEAVIGRILAEDRSKIKTSFWIIAAAFAISGWAALMGIYKFTPIVKVLENCLYSVFYIIEDFISIAGNIIYGGFTGILKLFVLERAVGRAGDAIIGVYSPVLMGMIILMAGALLLYDYMFNLIRR